MKAEVGTVDPALGELLDRAPCGFVSFEDDGRILHINHTLLERLGYQRASIADRHIENLLGIGSRIFYQTHLFPLLKLHGQAQEIFILLRTSAGDDVPMLCNAARRERAGSSAVIDCVFIEVKERRKFDEALIRARQAADSANVVLEARSRQAEEQSKAKSNFLATMSHELRTPLNAIGGYAQLLTIGVHGPITPGQEEALARIERSQRQLLHLINDVLDLSRIEAGRIDYRMERVQLLYIVDATRPMIEPQMAKKGLTLHVAVPPKAAVVADKDRMQQILLNLLTNAVKFTPEGGRIRIDGGYDSPSRGFLSVSDTGIGIPADMVDSVFEAFTQVDSPHASKREGTGLGLAISREFARGMGGDLTLRSEVGKGSTFTLTLPPAE